jgi:hypothetical protein
MKLKATFSDGQVDVYNGTRAVTVGWQLTTPEGRKTSGHSMDEKKARATALGYARYGAPFPHVDKPPSRATAGAYAYFHKLYVIERGFKSHAAAYADYQNKMIARRAACKVEIVPVEPV